MGVTTAAIIAGAATAAQTAGTGIAAAGSAIASGAATVGSAVATGAQAVGSALTTTVVTAAPAAGGAPVVSTGLSGLGKAAVTGAVTAGTSVASEKMAGKPPSAGELANEASRKAEKKRLAFSASKATKGKTMFTSPQMQGSGGQPLKEKLG
jgi:hypothetical protein